MAGAARPWPVFYRPETESTMDWARRVVPAAPANAFRLETGRQWRGRGRRGGVWYDRPESAVLTTLALRRGSRHDPGDPQPGILALRAGLAVCRTLEALGIRARVRWPNDILVDDRKISGILVEADARWFLIGIGVNLRLPTAPDPARFATSPTALDRHLPAPPGRAELGARLDGALETALTGIHWHGDLDARLAWRGELVRIIGDAEEHSGQLLGLDHSGALLLQGADGVSRVFSGSLRR